MNHSSAHLRAEEVLLRGIYMTQGSTHDGARAWLMRLRERFKRVSASTVVGGSIILFVYITYVPLQMSA